MKYLIRRLKPSESSIYRAIRLEALKSYPEYFGASYAEQSRLEKLYFERIIEENSSRGIMMGAFFNEELIGICGVTFETKILQNAGEIIQMYVKKKHQGNKIAKDLIERLFDHVKQRKEVKFLVLGVDKNNIPAIKTYNNCGFEVNTDIKEEDGVLYMSLLM